MAHSVVDDVFSNGRYSCFEWINLPGTICPFAVDRCSRATLPKSPPEGSGSSLESLYYLGIILRIEVFLNRIFMGSRNSEIDVCVFEFSHGGLTT